MNPSDQKAQPNVAVTTALPTPDVNQDFLKSVDEILPYVDPDSPRFMDWITIFRNQCGVNETVMSDWDITNEQSQWKMGHLIGMLAEACQDITDKTGVQCITYFSSTISRFWWVKDNVPVLIAVVGVTDGRLSSIATGDREYSESFIQALKDNFPVDDRVAVTEITGFGQNGPQTAEIFLNKEVEDKDEAFDAFYPSIVKEFGTINNFVEEYNQDNASVLLLLSKPGTGKSTLCRRIIRQLERKRNTMVTMEPVMKNPALLPCIAGGNTEDTLVFEDADNMLYSRESGNDQMSGLLSQAEGIGTTKRKIIITTNLASGNKIDEALKRDGRAWNIIELRNLEGDEINAARAAAGLEPISEEALAANNHSMSLAKALNYKSDTKGMKREGQTVGFGQG